MSITFIAAFWNAFMANFRLITLGASKNPSWVFGAHAKRKASFSFCFKTKALRLWFWLAHPCANGLLKKPTVFRGALLLLLSQLWGCASVPLPVEAFTQAKAAIAAAQRANAAENAPVDLKLAGEFLANAERASSDKDQQSARFFAEKAQVHAELARVKAEHAALRAKVQAQEAENTKLLNEIRADNGNAP
jgi:hypothetical protein